MNQDHETRYVRVIVDRAIHRELDYSLPENLAARVGVGSRVRVPFRDRSANRSHHRRCAGVERAGARTGAVDRHLLLLPDRNGDAQYAAASDPTR